MEIGPISGVRPVVMIRPSPEAPDLSRVVEVEHPGRSGDDEYTPANRKAARGLEDEEDVSAGRESPEPEARPEAADSSCKVNFFA